MKLVANILILVAACWMFASCYRPLLASVFWWRVAFGVLTLAGMGSGMCLVNWTYHESPTLKLAGYPFPIGAYEFFDGRWHGGVIARQPFLAWAADAGLALLAFLTPFRIAQRLARRLTKSHVSTKF